MNQTIKIIQYISLLITFIGFIYYLLYLRRHEAKLQIYSRIFLCISLILLIFDLYFSYDKLVRIY